MVHALMELHRILRPSGRLIDIRPLGEGRHLQLVWPDRVLDLGDIEVLGPDADDEAANRALDQVEDQALFLRQRRDAIQLDYYWDSVEALKDHIRAHWHNSRLPGSLERRARGLMSAPHGRLRAWRTLQITLLQKA